jgi:hypothetical protein
MGVFLSMSGIIGAPPAAVERALSDFIARRGGSLEPDTEAAVEHEDIAVIAGGEGGASANTTVVYPENFEDFDAASEHLSRALKRPVFAFHIHDEDLWMFVLYHDGEAVTRFSTQPEYFGDLDDEALATWAGDPVLVAAHVPGVLPTEIEDYFREWDEATLALPDPPKAYDDDEFAIGNCWQLLDFMRKLGLSYPIDERGGITGNVYRLNVPAA